MYMQNKCIFWSAVHMVATQAGFASTYSKCEIMFLSEHAQYTYSTRKGLSPYHSFKLTCIADILHKRQYTVTMRAIHAQVLCSHAWA